MSALFGGGRTNLRFRERMSLRFSEGERMSLRFSEGERMSLRFSEAGS
jgi:hypothetical protein